MERILEAVGLSTVDAQVYDHQGEPVIATPIAGDGYAIWRRARAGLPEH